MKCQLLHLSLDFQPLWCIFSKTRRTKKSSDYVKILDENKQQSNKSPTLVMLSKPPDTRKAVGLSRAGNSLEVLWCSPQTILSPGLSTYIQPLLQEDPQFFLGLRTSCIIWGYGTSRKEKRNSLVWYGLISVMTGQNDEERVESKILLVKEQVKNWHTCRFIILFIKPLPQCSSGILTKDKSSSYLMGPAWDELWSASSCTSLLTCSSGLLLRVPGTATLRSE